MSTLTHPLQHVPRKDHDRRLRRSQRHCQHWRPNSHRSSLCCWHWWLAGEEEELTKLVECLDKAFTAYSMEISTETTKLMTNNTSGISTEIEVNGQKLEIVTSFEYLCSIITDEGSEPEILSRIARTAAALKRLKPVWNGRSISLKSKIRLTLPCHIHLSVCLRIINSHSRAPKKNTSHGNKVLP